MKEIKAIIQPFVLERVLDALNELDGLPGVTISEVLGWGRLPERRQKHDVIHAGHGLSKKSKLEIVVDDARADAVLQAIRKAAHTGNAGDGKIFVYEVAQIVRIRTGEQGADAI
ncbi:MAG TPA: P-II family nitrogen regulator [Planctomycetes bacterium]|nr:P-II family nitrogen regulator [Planctomycetota bacterium]